MSSSINIETSQANGTDDCIRRMLQEIKHNARLLKRQTNTTRRIKKDIAKCSLGKEGSDGRQIRK